MTGARRQGWLIAAATVAGLLVLTVVTTARRDPVLHAPDRDRFGRGSGPPPSNLLPSANQPSGQSATPRGAPQAGDSLVGDILAWVVGIAVLLLLLWVLFGVVQAVRRQLAQRRAAREDSVLPQVSDAVADAVEQVARRQHARLAEGTPRNAVVACWVDLEQTVATAGLERRPSETSAELALRVLDETDADRDALRTLSRLYRAARYSEHPITEGDRAAAGAALEALHRSLRVKATL